MHFTTLPSILALLSAAYGSVIPEEYLDTHLEARAGAKTIVYDCSKTPQICWNTCFAVHCLGYPEKLNPGAGTADATKKRQEWGYGSVASKTYFRTVNGEDYHSPEEYPYASSAEGGLDFTSGGASHHVSLRMVPNNQGSVQEQKSQGGKVKGMATCTDCTTDTSAFTNTHTLGPNNPCPKTTTNTGGGYCKLDGENAYQFTATAKGAFGYWKDLKAAGNTIVPSTIETWKAA